MKKQFNRAVIHLFDINGNVQGTGFSIEVLADGNPAMAIRYVVTAKHVINGLDKVIGRFNSKLMGTHDVTYDLALSKSNGDYWEHGDAGVDIVVFRTSTFENIDHVPISTELIASKATFQAEDIAETDEVIFPGLLSYFPGEKANCAMTRSGKIASIPQEPIPIETLIHGQKVTVRQEVILISGSAPQGASGSPLFLWPPQRIKNSSVNFLSSPPYLIGIVTGFFNAVPRKVQSIQVPINPIGTFQENSGIAIAFPSWRILEIINSDSFRKRHAEISKTI